MLDQSEDRPDAAYLQRVDRAAFAALAPDERLSQKLIDHNTGARHCSVAYIQTPPGGGSPEGLHTHEVDQIFYILEGTMSIEVDGREFIAEPGSLVHFPAGVKHRNWNGGHEPTVHLAVNTPLPDPAKPFARKADVEPG